jgi:hypothetical protein
MTGLELIKATFQSRESLMLLVRDEELKKVLVAWTMYRPEFKDFAIRSSDNPIIVLGRLWGSVGPVDFPRLADIAGVPETRTQKFFERLRAAGLAYPDGTINKFAMAALRLELETFIIGKAPKGAIPREPAKGPDASRVGVPELSPAGVQPGQAAAPRADQTRHGGAAKTPRKNK